MKNVRDYQEIVSFVTGMSHEALLLEGVDLSIEQEKRIDELMERRKKGEPLAHILGSVEFFGCQIAITPDTLIPRLESELLVEQALDFIAEEGALLDLCAGSGCLGLAIKKARPKLDVYLSDISPACVEVMRRNAKSNQLQVSLYQGDLLKPLKGKKFDYVICNPPYVAEVDYETLENSVKGYEPKAALLGGRDGLSFYRSLAKELPRCLNIGGRIFLEIGYNQGAQVEKIFSKSHWSDQAVKKDLSGLDRFFFATCTGFA